MKLPIETLRQIKLEYYREYGIALKRLQELKEVLDQLEEVSLPDSLISNTDSAILQLSKTAEAENTDKKSKKAEPKKTKGKRGRKSVWSKFVTSRLRSIHRPLTLDELTNHAMVTMKLDPSSFDKTRKSLVSAVFALRKKDKVVTIPIPGTREKRVALKNWIGEDGNLLPDFE